MRITDLTLVSTTEILNAVGECHGDNLIEKIIDFCETNQIDEKELGDILEEDDGFKSLFYQDCIRSKYIKDVVANDKLQQMDSLDVWY